MLPLHGEWQAKSLDRKRHLGRIIVEPQQIELADDRLNAALQFSDPLFLSRVMLNDVRNNFLADANLLEEVDLTQCRIYQVALRDHELLLHIEALHPDIVHAVPQNGIHLLVIVVTEDKQAAAQIQVNAREILVLKAIVLAAVRQMDEQIVDLLALGRL